GRVPDGDHLGVRGGLVHPGQHLDVFVLDPDELVLDALLACGRIEVVVAAGSADRPQLDTLHEHVAERQAVAADTDGDDVGLVVQLSPLDLRGHRGPTACGRLYRADRGLLRRGDVGDGGAAAADVGQVHGLAGRELGELPIDDVRVGVGGAVAPVPRRVTERR